MRFSLFSCLLVAVGGTATWSHSPHALGQVPIHLQPSQAMPHGLTPIEGDFGWRASTTPNPMLDKLTCSEGAERAWSGYHHQRHAHLSHINRHSLCPGPGAGPGLANRGAATSCGAKPCNLRASVWSGSLACEDTSSRNHGCDQSFQPPRSSTTAPSVLGASPVLAQPIIPSPTGVGRSQADPPAERQPSPPLAATSPEATTPSSPADRGWEIGREPKSDVLVSGNQPLASPQAATPVRLGPNQPTNATEEKRSSFGAAIRDWFNSDPSGNR